MTREDEATQELVEECIAIEPHYFRMSFPSFQSGVVGKFQSLTTLRTSLDVNDFRMNDLQTAIFQLPLLRTLDIQFVSQRRWFSERNPEKSCQGAKSLAECIFGMSKLENLMSSRRTSQIALL